MRSRFTKYKFNYSKDDYIFNLRYKWMKQHKTKNHINHYDQPNIYFVEIKSSPILQVQQLSPEMCLHIDKAKREGEKSVFVRITQQFGHYIKLDQMILNFQYNLLNMQQRKVFSLTSLPQNAVIYEPLSMSAMNFYDHDKVHNLQNLEENSKKQTQINNFNTIKLLNYEKGMAEHKLQELGETLVNQQKCIERFHWMEIIISNKQSLNDLIERNYQLYSNNYSNGVIQFEWQDQRFILDLVGMSLQNTKSLQITGLKRVEIRQIQNINKFMELTQKDLEQCILILGGIIFIKNK